MSDKTKDQERDEEPLAEWERELLEQQRLDEKPTLRPVGRISIDRTNTTMVRLDLRETNGFTTFGAIKKFIAECESRGATDETMAVIVYTQSILGGFFQPILGVSIDHESAVTNETRG